MSIHDIYNLTMTSYYNNSSHSEVNIHAYFKDALHKYINVDVYNSINSTRTSIHKLFDIIKYGSNYVQRSISADNMLYVDILIILVTIFYILSIIYRQVVSILCKKNIREEEEEEDDDDDDEEEEEEDNEDDDEDDDYEDDEEEDDDDDDDDDEEDDEDEDEDILDDIDEIDKTVLIFIRTYSRLEDTYVIFGRDCDAYKDELKMMKCRFLPKLIVGSKGWLFNKTEYNVLNQWYKNVTRSP
jgi:hypothetical protein